MIVAIVPAAGLSNRMGTQKLLLPFGGTTVVGHVVDRLLASAVGEVRVVVGHEGGRVAGALAGRPVKIVVNPDCEKGMLSSIRCGLRDLPPECEAALVALGDQPSLTSELVDRMARSFAVEGKGILVPSLGGKRGHPVLFSASYLDEIRTRFDGVGLRGLLRAHPGDVFELEVEDSAVLSDMDYPEDYRREIKRFEET